MITTKHVAKAETSIAVAVERVWKALTDPETIKKYMFGTTVTSDWKEGSKITWSGEWEGKHYEDKGKILRMEPGRQLQYSHFTPSAGLEDIPENYHIVTIALEERNKQTHIILTQSNNADEKTKEHSERNWNMMLASLKELLEQPN